MGKASLTSSRGAVDGTVRALPRRLVSLLLLGASACSAEAVSTQQHTSDADVQVHPGVTYQTIVGWEATAGIGQTDFPQTVGNWRNAVLDSTAALGINRIRLEVTSGIENDQDYFAQYLSGTIPRVGWVAHRDSPINDNADPNVINTSGFHFTQVDFTVDLVVEPLRQRLAAAGEDLYVNLLFIGGTSNVALVHKQQPAEYAELVLATFQHLESTYGWVPDGFELILEPDASADWSGAQIGRALVAVAARLSAAGYDPDYIGPSTASMFNAPYWYDDMIAVSGAAGLLDEFAYHRYYGATAANLQPIAARASQRGIGTSMLEHIGSGHEDLLEDLVVGGNVAWQQYTLAFPYTDNGAQYFLVDQSTNAVTPGSRTKYLGQVFRYVRAQAVRVLATTSDSTLSPVAFMNSDGAYVVVVDAATGGDFSVAGLPAGTYGVTYASASSYGVTLPDTTISDGEFLVVPMPVTGLFTIFRR